MKNTHSEIKVYPKNWDRKLNASLNKVWYCYYYFYSKDCPNGTLVKFRGMNRAKSLEEKQAVTQWLIDREIDLLKRGYNPIKKTIEVINGFVNENTPFIQALEIAKSKIKVADSTMVSIKHTLKIVYKAAEKTGVSFTPISKVKKRDIRNILDVVLDEGYSNDRYNKIKTNLSILYNYLVDMDIFEHNYIHFIRKLPHTPEPRKILRANDKQVFEKLKGTNYPLWRFCKMFYYSGCRITEFRNLELKDIDIKRQEFTIFEKKGRRYHKVLKPINNNVIGLWRELLDNASPNDNFLFGNELKPSDVPITQDALSHRYRRWVNYKLGINVDLYALKHTYLNDITVTYGISQAKDIAGHTNERTTRIYAVDYKEQVLERQKHIDTGF